MANSKIYKLIDLIEDVKKVEEMISLHQKDADSDVMLSQYQAKKVKLTGNLISELNSPPFKSTSGFLFIKHFLDKFYADPSDLIEDNDKEVNELKKLEAVL